MGKLRFNGTAFRLRISPRSRNVLSVQHPIVFSDGGCQTDGGSSIAGVAGKKGKMPAVITQNIDGLHQAAGSGKVHEIHGTCRTGHCIQCSAGFDMAGFYIEIKNGRLATPLCPKCRALIKPDIVLFEEMLPETAWNASVEAAQQCDLMLVFGSSLVVYPAAELPMIALENGARLVIVNLEATYYDHMAEVLIQGKLGEFAKYALATFT